MSVTSGLVHFYHLRDGLISLEHLLMRAMVSLGFVLFLEMKVSLLLDHSVE